MYYTYNKRKRANEQYPIMEVLQLAVAVDRKQGFVTSKQKSYDIESQTHIHDNRTIILHKIRHMNGKQDTLLDDFAIEIIDEDHIKAREIYDYFDQLLMMEKISDSLIKRHKDGTMNTYNDDLYHIFNSGNVDINVEMAMVASLPNSFRIAHKREAIERFYAENPLNGYIGELKQRMNMTANILDVKYIPRHSVHLVTFTTQDNKIGRFFLNNNQETLAKNIDGKSIEIKGTVKKHSVNEYSKCQETMFNRVKIEE